MDTVTPEEIKRQRSLNWPDFHPEDYCHRCGRPNISWWVESELWNRAIKSLERGVLEILCPPCFVELWEGETNQSSTWELRLDIANPLPTGESLEELESGE